MPKILEKCPACGGDIAVTRLSCTRCECEVTGRFQPTVFNRLKPESLAFVETFVRLRGNIKEMERELGVAYSAVRSRLDEVISELGFVPGAQPEEPTETPKTPTVPNPPGSRLDILERLDQGKISASEAAEILGQLKS